MSTAPKEPPRAASDTSGREVNSVPPVEVSARVSSPATSAGGVPAVAEAFSVTLKQAGIRRGVNALRMLNQKDGFDCPGCAWPDPDGERTANEYCENGAKAVAEEATTRKVTAEFFSKWSVSALSRQSDYWLSQQGRLTHPMFLPAGSDHYQPISWDEAFHLIARELNALASPDEAIFYTSGRTSNEAAFLYQLFVRQFGTNNLPDCSNMCHESSGAALNEVIGVGKGCVKLADFAQADAIFIIGQNPGTNHPRMLNSLQQAKEAAAKIVSINPMPEIGNFRFKDPQDLKNPLRIPQ